MFFSSKALILRLIVLLSLLLVGVRCSYFFEKKEEDKTLSMDRSALGLSSCIEKTSEVFSDYFNDLEIDHGVLSNNISVLKGCYVEVLDKFLALTNKDPQVNESIRAEDIKQMMIKVIGKKTWAGIPDGIVTQFFKLKTFVIGGETDLINRKELVKFQGFISLIMDGMIEILPYRPVLLRANLSENDFFIDIDYFTESFQVFEKNRKKIIEFIGQKGRRGRINIVEFSNFVFENIVGVGDLKDYENKVKIFLSFKRFIFSQKRSSASNAYLTIPELNFLSRELSDFYMSYLEFNNFVKDEKLFTKFSDVVTFVTSIEKLLLQGRQLKGQTLLSLKRILQRSGESLIRLAKVNRDREIAFQRINIFLQDMQEYNFISESFKADAIGRFIYQFSQQWILGKKSDLGLHVDQIRYLESFVEKWSYRQLFINQLELGGHQQISLEEITKMSRGYNSEYLDDWFELLKTSRLIKWNERSSLKYRRDKEKLGYEELVVSSALYGLTELFYRPFQEKSGMPLLQQKISQDETQKIYEVLRILGISNKFMDSRAFSTGKNTFVEGNLFSVFDRNDDWLDFYEGYEVVQIMINSGVLAGKIHSSVSKSCHKGFVDVLGVQVLESHCFREFLHNIFPLFFGQLSNFSTFWNNSTQIQKENFIVKIIQASQGGGVTGKDFSVVEIRVMVTMIYYLEGLFLEYDKNSDSMISGPEEVNEFFDNFSEFSISFIELYRPDIISEVGVEKLQESYANAIISYVFKNQSIPKVESWWSKAAFWHWAEFESHKWSRSEGVIRFDQTIGVLATIQRAKRKGKIQSIKKFIVDKGQIFQHEILNTRGQPHRCRTKFDREGAFVKQSVSLFCKFSQDLSCSEDAHEPLFKWLKRYMSDADLIKDADQFYEEMNQLFFTDSFLFTQCYFPFLDSKVSSN